MTRIAADFTLTFEEFTEGFRLQRARKRFLAGPPERSRWIGCGWLAGLFMLLLILFFIACFITGTRTTSPSGAVTISTDSRPATFFLVMLPWPIIGGLGWLVFSRSVVERRMGRRVILLLLAIGLSMSLSTAITTEPAAAPATPQTSSSSLLGFLPWVITAVGFMITAWDIYRQAIRIAWDGQPLVRQPLHVEADEQRLIVQTPLTRTEYAWAAIITFSEGTNVLVLSISALTFHIIPKRALDGAALESLRSLLRSRTVDAQTSWQGFDVVPTPAVPLPPPPLSDDC